MDDNKKKIDAIIGELSIWFPKRKTKQTWSLNWIKG